uniref:Uncharacterized protein n=1 Tax=Lepeophtheirus salmonis TaxID=72036 RepID=A0A0K2TLR2_LEPSM
MIYLLPLVVAHALSFCEFPYEYLWMIWVRLNWEKQREYGVRGLHHFLISSWSLSQEAEPGDSGQNRLM